MDELIEALKVRLQWVADRRGTLQLSEETGISRPTLNNYRLGYKKPSLENAQIIFDAMGYELIIIRKRRKDNDTKTNQDSEITKGNDADTSGSKGRGFHSLPIDFGKQAGRSRRQRT